MFYIHEKTPKHVHLVHRLVPKVLADNPQTFMKSVILLLSLFSSSLINLLLIFVLQWAFKDTPVIGEYGTMLVLFSSCCLCTSFIIFNRFAQLIAAGNIAQIGIYVAAVFCAWQTGGIISPLILLFLIPPVYAFVLTNIRSGVMWTILISLTMLAMWIIEELGFWYPDGIMGYEIPMASMIIREHADFARMSLMIPLLTCISILSVVVIYEINSIRMYRLLFNERNRFAHKASHDPLTGLANREEFNLRLDLAMETARHAGYSIAVVYIDLDGFKPVNDTYGHHEGDVVLKIISQRLSGVVRGTDTVARLGGDEFGIILQGIGSEQRAQPILDKMLSVIAQDISLENGITVNVYGSLGVAFYPTHSINASQLCRQADEAMYLSKETKNCWHSYSELAQKA